MLIWSELLRKVSPDFGGIPAFDIALRTVLNTGMKANHQTRRVKRRNGRDPRVQVGKVSFAYVIVYYNLRRRALHPKGKHKMTTPRHKDLPVWQGLMELDSGELALPDEYKPKLPQCAPEEAVAVMGAWLKTVSVRQRKYPGCACVFDPEMLSLMLGKPRSYVLTGWSWLEEYWYVDSVWEKGPTGELQERFTPGAHPIADPDAHDQWRKTLADEWLDTLQ